MGRAELKAGAVLDLASGKELDELGGRICDAIATTAHEPPLTEFVTANGLVDAGGALGGGVGGDGLVVFTVPTGRHAQIHRLAITDDVATPVAPQAAGWLMGWRNRPGPTSLVYVLPEDQPASAVQSVYPVAIVDGGSGPVLKDGDKLVFTGAGLVAGRTIGFALQARLWEAPAP